MIGEILNAIMQECIAYLGAGSVILKTNYKPKNIPAYSMPLILLEVAEATESGQFPGGLTQMDWQIGLNAYNYMLDILGEDITGASTDLLNIPIDGIRQHFSYGVWLADNATNTGKIMDDITNNYGFKFALGGVVPADALDEDGDIMGYRIMFDSCSFDDSTSYVKMSDHPLEHLVQINNPPFDA